MSQAMNCWSHDIYFLFQIYLTRLETIHLGVTSFGGYIGGTNFSSLFLMIQPLPGRRHPYLAVFFIPVPPLLPLLELSFFLQRLSDVDVGDRGDSQPLAGPLWSGNERDGMGFHTYANH